jgi:hypothetical protein
MFCVFSANDPYAELAEARPMLFEGRRVPVGTILSYIAFIDAEVDYKSLSAMTQLLGGISEGVRLSRQSLLILSTWYVWLGATPGLGGMMTSLKGFMPVGLILSLIAADVRGDSNAALNAAASNLVYQAICQVVIADMLQRITPKVRNQLQADHKITPPQNIDLNDLPNPKSDIPVIAAAIKGAPISASSEVSKKANAFIQNAKPGEAAGNSNNGVKESDSGSEPLDSAKEAAQAQLEDMNPNEIAAIAEEAKNNLLKTMVDDNGDPVAEPKNPFQDQTKFDVCSKGATEHQESPPEEPPLLPPVPAPTPGNASGTAQGQKFPAKPVAPTPPAATIRSARVSR